MGIMLFTSGTTAMSKAVMLSHKNLCADIMDIASVLDINDKDVMLSFLPLHHVFECTTGFLYPLYKGACVVYCDGIRHIQENLQEYHVSAMVSVPLLFENMYRKLMKAIEKQGKLETVNKGIKISNALLKLHIDVRKKIFKEIHDKLGGRVRLFVSGAAALDPEVEKGYNDVGIRIVQGYGLTETSPVVATGSDFDYRLGSIGKKFPSMEVKLEGKDENGVGELVVKGPNVMLGYYENEEETKKVLKDGWFYTGDLAKIDKDGFIFMYGRKKSVIVLKNGKNVFPEELESLINRIEGVKESFVYGKPEKGDEKDPKVCVKVVYDAEIVNEMYKLEKEDDIQKFFLAKVKEINKTMPTYKYIKQVSITTEDLIKTTTAKIKRHEEIKKVLV
jgi:long-chain acyl-CoA synthetase